MGEVIKLHGDDQRDQGSDDTLALRFYKETNILAYQIPESLAHKYRGCSIGPTAWAVIEGDRVVDIGYGDPESDFYTEKPEGALEGSISCHEFCYRGVIVI